MWKPTSTVYIYKDANERMRGRPGELNLCSYEPAMDHGGIKCATIRKFIAVHGVVQSLKWLKDQNRFKIHNEGWSED